jgi:hypothetical protein
VSVRGASPNLIVSRRGSEPHTEPPTGTLGGTLNIWPNDCGSFLGSGLSASTSGSLIAHWTHAVGSPTITPTTSTVNVNQFNAAKFNDGGFTSSPFDEDNWAGTYELLQIGSDAGHGNTLPPSVSYVERQNLTMRMGPS